MRTILRGMIAAQLIIGAAVGGADEEIFESFAVWIDVESNAHKAAGESGRVRAWAARYFGLDDPVFET